MGTARGVLVAVRVAMRMAVPCLVFGMGTAAGGGVTMVVQVLRLG